ncbi:diphthine synthase [Candidatus Woesearchaeota archaeon]|nr:diphthine synthase [Candidatus Woesearchaeota archaeon]
MTLTLIGLGLSDEKDITVKGLEAIKKADKVYLDIYTSRLSDASITDLERFYGKKIIPADRNLAENEAEKTILKDAMEGNAAFLAVGDPMSATTHVDLMLRAEKMKIDVTIIPNTSILTAVGVVGLDLYKYGRTTTIPFENKNITSPYEVLKQNQKSSLHTLFLLDLDPHNNRFMAFADAIKYLLGQGMPRKQLVIGCCQIGSEKQVIIAGEAEKVARKQFDKFPQCLIVPARMHFMEEAAIGKHIIEKKE